MGGLNGQDLHRQILLHDLRPPVANLQEDEVIGNLNVVQLAAIVACLGLSLLVGILLYCRFQAKAVDAIKNVRGVVAAQAVLHLSHDGVDNAAMVVTATLMVSDVDAACATVADVPTSVKEPVTSEADNSVAIIGNE